MIAAIRRWVKERRESAFVPPAWAPGELTALIADETELLPAITELPPEPEPYQGDHRLTTLDDWWAWLPGRKRLEYIDVPDDYEPRHAHA